MRNALSNPSILLAIGIAFLCIVLQALGWDQLLRFDRVELQNGNWWLLLTGNFVHLNWSHLALNMTGLLLVVILVWPNFNLKEWLAIILIASMGVGLGLYLRDPHIIWYVGFSGTLHGLMLAGTLADIRRYPLPAIALLAVVCAKLFYEQRFGAVPGSESVAGGNVVVNSHLYGAITGALVGLLLMAKNWKRPAVQELPNDAGRIDPTE